MQNFVYNNPTRILFGRDMIARLGTEAAPHGTRALLVTGTGSVRASGVYDRARAALESAGITCTDLSGVVSNPLLSKVREGVDLARNAGADMVVAVGSGSVLDSSKAIAAGARADHDVWDFFTRARRIESALPVFAVLTLAATGSEANGSAVVTNDDTREKFSAASIHTYPKVSILDPETTYTVSPAYSAYGAVDAVAHLLEPYFNNANENDAIQREITEGVIRSIRQAITHVLADPRHYDGRATLMWGSTLALNGLTQAGMGATGFPVHMIEHSLSALYDVPHGAGLSIVYPGWLRHVLDEKSARIARLGRTVFGVEEASDRDAALATIDALTAWYREIGSPVCLADWNIPASDIPAIASNAERLAQLWNLKRYTADEIAAVLAKCV
jgi:alcohol dehydrogenase YqhD (iron-dependent ADH family)